MNWLYSFIAALVLIFAFPMANNFDGVKIIAGDIKKAIVNELSTLELSQIFDQEAVSKILDGSLFFGDSDGTHDSSGSSNSGSDSSSSQVQLTDKQKKYQTQLKDKYKESVSERTMLLLATEVYQGAIKDVIYYSMPLSRNKVDGWTVVARYPESQTGAVSTKVGTSAVLWVNDLDKETYCLSIAGTDQISDMLQYIPMETSSTRSQQQNEVAQIASNINNDVKKHKAKMGLGDIKKLYLTGHSLGAFLAMSLGTDIIDSSIATSKHTTTHALTKVQDISSTLSASNVFTYTFAGPGLMVQIPPKMDSKLKSLLQIGDTVPLWVNEKIANNKARAYDKNLIQYTNTRDIVPNLHTIVNNLSGFVFKHWGVDNPGKLFVHVGKEYETTSKKYSLSDTYTFIRRLDVFKGDNVVSTALNTAAVFSGLQYHMPSTYLEQIDNHQFKLIN